MYAVFRVAKVVLDCDLDRLEFGFFAAFGSRVWGSSACNDWSVTYYNTSDRPLLANHLRRLAEEQRSPSIVDLPSLRRPLAGQLPILPPPLRWQLGKAFF